MEQLIAITTDGQGSSVVSARELYTFLEVKKQFADWIKNRIDKYGLVENQDYTTYSLIGEKGRPLVEYALTLDAAKELAMVEGNAKGKQARQYFIQAEKSLRHLTDRPANTALATDQVLLQVVSQQTQLLTNQQQQLDQLRADIETIRQTGHRPPQPRTSHQLGLPGMPPQSRPSTSLRSLINQRVDNYCARWNYDRRETWHYLYKRLQNLYSINAHQLMKKPGESMLDALERYGHLDRLYAIVKEELPPYDE